MNDFRFFILFYVVSKNISFQNAFKLIKKLSKNEKKVLLMQIKISFEKKLMI